MAETTIKGFEFPVFDVDGNVKEGEEKTLQYDYASLANIPAHEAYVSLPNADEYKISNNVHVTKNLQVDGNVEIKGALTGNLVISSDSFGESLPTTQPRVAGRIFFVKLQD